MTNPALALHGGAGASKALTYDDTLRHMEEVAAQGARDLMSGAPAISVVVSAVRAMESSGLYIAGRGGAPNLAGAYELDACVMDGPTQSAGAVAALQGFQSPISIAREVMTQTPHVLLVGEGAAAFARSIGGEEIPAEAGWFTHAGAGESNYPPGCVQMGTVGCVARDRSGRLAAATSTAGVFGKMPGRISDSGIVGAGTWADGGVAVSCTGQGEYFIRTSAAAQLGFRLKAGEPLDAAATAVVSEIARLGGEGGLVAVDRDGNIAAPFASAGMKRAVLQPDGSIRAEIF